MARYRTTITSTKSPDDAFEYLADFVNAAEWDPGVVEGTHLTSGPPGPGSRFRLVASFLGRRVPLEYEIVAFERGRRVVFRADDSKVRSVDEIRFAGDGGETSVTYDADLRVKGLLGALVDPLLALAFRRIGDRAAAGLRRALNA
ncbi:MAG TPA: SRPBCC family protein [Acidimicrobiales bacterium]|nr:SRPBCC family protein [Acidimicrobiales bacterium]